jgi:hypothetical protein
MKKMLLWKNRCECDTLEMFVSMTKYPEENNYTSKEIKPHVLTHLTNPRSMFKDGFPELNIQQRKWMRIPFAVAIGKNK